MKYMAFSRCWARFLAQQNNLAEEKEIVLAYAIEMLVINLANLILTLLAGWVLGVLKGTAVCLLTVAAFRHTAGGAHSRSPLRCAVVTILIFPLMALIAEKLVTINYPIIDILSAGAVVTGLLAVFILAPVDTPEAPIISPVRRRRLKILSILLMAVFCGLIVVLYMSEWHWAVEFQGYLSLGILWVSFTLSKAGHYLMTLIDSIQIPFERRRREA